MAQPKDKSDILVVDDQPANLKLMEDMLKQEGHGVRSFPRGRLALAAAAQQPPDLILLDINMPEMDGFEVCKRLKADKLLAAIPVIFLSALNDTKDKVRGFRSGAVDFITKPFQFEEVQARIEAQLSLRELRTRLEKQNSELGDLVKLQVREIAESQMTTIFALAKLAESRDNDTGKHLERVQILCKLLATGLSVCSKYGDMIDGDFVRNIFHASPLHGETNGRGVCGNEDPYDARSADSGVSARKTSGQHVCHYGNRNRTIAPREMERQRLPQRSGRHRDSTLRPHHGDC